VFSISLEVVPKPLIALKRKAPADEKQRILKKPAKHL
jgi:hypothetical protein